MSTVDPDVPKLENPTSAANAPGQLADAWQRVAARVVDYVLIAVAITVLLMVLGAVIAFLPGPAGVFAGVLYAVVTSALTVAYFAVLESRDGQTLGKRLLGIRVVGADGRTPSLEQTIRRNVWTGLGIASAIPVIGSALGAVAMLAASVLILVGIVQDVQRRQGWHDTFAGGTRVVRA